MVFIQYVHGLHHVQRMQTIFPMFFLLLIFMFRDKHLAENLRDWAKRLKEKWTPQDSWDSHFPTLRWSCPSEASMIKCDMYLEGQPGSFKAKLATDKYFS